MAKKSRRVRGLVKVNQTKRKGKKKTKSSGWIADSMIHYWTAIPGK